MSTAFGTRPWTGNPKFFPPVTNKKPLPVAQPVAQPVLPEPEPVTLASAVLDRNKRKATTGENRAYDRGYRAGFQHGQQAAAQSMLSEGIKSNRWQRVTGEEGSIIAIAQEVAEAYGFSSWRDLRSRKGDAARFARQQAMWRCVNETNNSLVKIGRILGGFDHTTVIHACRVYEDRIRKASLTGQ